VKVGAAAALCACAATTLAANTLAQATVTFSIRLMPFLMTNLHAARLSFLWARHSLTQNERSELSLNCSGRTNYRQLPKCS
jgi:hypothetical protein